MYLLPHSLLYSCRQVPGLAQKSINFIQPAQLLMHQKVSRYSKLIWILVQTHYKKQGYKYDTPFDKIQDMKGSILVRFRFMISNDCAKLVLLLACNARAQNRQKRKTQNIGNRVNIKFGQSINRRLCQLLIFFINILSFQINSLNGISKSEERSNLKLKYEKKL